MIQRIVEPDIDLTGESMEVLEVPEPTTKAGYGRAAGWRAFMWDGTETTVVLAWDIHGKTNDEGRRYLQKKHCLCCGFSGFRAHCTMCRKKTFSRCHSANDKKQVIPAIYLREADVPFPQLIYGEVDCFLPTCTRRGDRGFRSLEEMHMHGTGRHTKQFEAHMAVKQSQETSKVDLLQQQLAALTAAMVAGKASETEPVKKRRTRKDKFGPVAGTSDAPLYEKGT